MKWIFWLSAAGIAYTYAGYPLWLWILARCRPWPVRRGAIEPRISILMVVRNEEAVLRDKLRNLLDLDYCSELCQIVVVSDGSEDGTADILREYGANPRVTALLNQLPASKARGLNEGMQLVTGDFVVFTDARQKIEPQAIKLMMENFADTDVGAVSGELMLGDPAAGESGKGMGLYWRMEKKIRELEAGSGSVPGATGALYAVRRELLGEVPPETILDDVFIPMSVVRQGFRVVFDPRARAWDSPNLGTTREFRRKVRTLTGNYQLLQLAPWLLREKNPIRFEFVSHKLMRLVAPFALIALLISSLFTGGLFYRSLFCMQTVFYGAGMLGWSGWELGPLSSITGPAFTFASLNVAALVAFTNFVTGDKSVWMDSPLRKQMRAR